jgi:CHAT domain-containing protein
MIPKKLIGCFFFIFIYFTGWSGVYANDDSVQDLRKLNARFQASITAYDTAKSKLFLEAILKALREENNDNLTASKSQYYIGVYYLQSGKNSEAVNWLKRSASISERMKVVQDTIYSKCLFNLGIAYSHLGDYKRMEQYTLKSLEIEKTLYGETSPLLLGGLSALVDAYFSLNEYNKAIIYGNKAINLVGRSIENYKSDMAVLYSNIGACYARLSDYSKAVLYFEKAEAMYKEYSLPEDDNYINLLNSLAANYFFLGLNDKSDEYFNKGIEKIGSSNSVLSLNFLNSFAIVLGNAGKVSKGEALIVNSLEKAKKFYGPDSRDYFEVIKNYAEYLSTFKLDIRKSLQLYEQCIVYLNNHEEDFSLKAPVLLGYSLALSANGESTRGLEIIQRLIFSDIPGKTGYSLVENPEIGLIEPVRWSINVFKAKYNILWDIYSQNHKIDYLLAASQTSELVISLIEKVRINISEDESRLVLGDRYRDSYLYTIRDFDLCYKNTGNKLYLDKAFEYCEKSKVAGLLASTRELKATQFHIPADIAELERRLKMEISFYEAKISEENSKKTPDASLISELKGSVLNATQKRDSLITLFEKKYPEYYLIKYNTQVIKPEEVSALVGRNNNYLNYVVSDTVLYICLVNRKNLQLFTVPVDSGFFNDIRQFRNFLSMPSENAKSNFLQYTQVGNRLYKIIIEPVRKYLISNKLLISPDNILSYIPFEAIPVRQVSDENILFSEIPYLMKYYSISYTYSATLLAESSKKDYSLRNSLIAFAPVYNGIINVDSLLNTRQTRVSTLHDLQFARTEAEYVTALTHGKLYINKAARESVFKREAAKYDIIHLAMHTILNDQYPMYSKLLFYQEKDSVEDGNLNTYEVYGVPLKAKMVMLSSCNTGTGILHSGEGILSLARGFVYSGSQSVVMSMWEIEDKSGAEIVKSYYKFLKKGDTKSNALRKARISYLKNADMLRSHPYFWSSLVIYGNNDPLYYSTKLGLIIGPAILLILIILIFYYLKLR